MEMPKRHGSSDSYRFGFQGYERDDELEGYGNSYDMGARIYDPRLGRTLSLDPEDQEYPMFSPYSSFGNNPISVTDPDGRLLRDSDGNLIVVDAGTKSTATVPGLQLKKDGTRIMNKVTYKDVFIFANDGTAIKARITTSVEYGIKMAGVEGVVTTEGDKNLTGIAEGGSDCSSNCHGVALAEGQLTIYSDDISETLLDEEEFNSVSEADADIAVFSDKDGKEAQHSAKKEGSEYIYTNGGYPTKKGSLERASYGGQYTNPEFKKEVKKKSNWAGGDTESNPGLRIFKSKEDAQKSNPNDSKKLQL